ncbi:hypothetical protein [Myxococcus llanfairpwllgwyngyllgogerychwyrndrobwllllantysiliogogogochensis]|uniref:hypothetical protein n=1 Tax=Myxococcus llanfairpwllgwyngyllgogerychwyrndrobwllllantysiliogogogochensis TaxID=2590453 RepID=UPI0015F0BB70|nr:hypothetical protein [Myxococcus llanfairpwllgwyngyllgogerychwyrndrobwllllantysiliogogogochensis]
MARSRAWKGFAALPMGGMVLDPFGGSGSALQLGRRAEGVELEERSFEVVARRHEAAGREGVTNAA